VTDIGSVVHFRLRTAEPAREHVGAEVVLVLGGAVRHRTVREQARSSGLSLLTFLFELGRPWRVSSSSR